MSYWLARLSASAGSRERALKLDEIGADTRREQYGILIKT